MNSQLANAHILDTKKFRSRRRAAAVKTRNRSTSLARSILDKFVAADNEITNELPLS